MANIIHKCDEMSIPEELEWDEGEWFYRDLAVDGGWNNVKYCPQCGVKLEDFYHGNHVQKR